MVLGYDLKSFDGGSQRTNLEFVVHKSEENSKHADIFHLLETELLHQEDGSAIIYCATKRRSEELAAFLVAKGVDADYFHSDLRPDSKKVTQQRFISGNLRVIAATNAFGMGIDKPDVRLVIHRDIPGSLENYLQEAGRAGRDRKQAKCVLLYSPDDTETQFGLLSRSQLTRREIHGILKAIRNLDRKRQLEGHVVATPGEILLEDYEDEFEQDTATDDTRVKTAVLWLEDAVLLSREENVVSVFPSSLRVQSVSEAQERIRRAGVEPAYQIKLESIIRTLMQKSADEGVSTDELMMVSGMDPKGLRNALHDLERLGVSTNDTVITAFVHKGVTRSSERRLEMAMSLETDAIKLLQETAPDMEVRERSNLHLRAFTQKLKDDGHKETLPISVRRVLESVATDGRGDYGHSGSLNIRAVNNEILNVTLLRPWDQIQRLSTIRLKAAGILLRHLVSRIRPNVRGVDLLAETTIGNLMESLRADPSLNQRANTERLDSLMNHALLWLHEQDVIHLNHGLTILRPAMTLKLSPERRRYTESDYSTLKQHYDEQAVQVHVVDFYAITGLESMGSALRLALDYFLLAEEEFIGRWLGSISRQLKRMTGPESWQKIVDSLRNPTQRAMVVDDRENANTLVLAGHGSGKTTVLVHRIAYLLRVLRTNPRSILALAYNRHAAVQIRQRLTELVGGDANGVMVMTCHAMAMRLTGTSFTGRTQNLSERDFIDVIRQATALLQGQGLSADEADEIRDRLLAGFRWILVDEYQDINEEQYQMISALVGRTKQETDDKLSLFAVGDDDQNLYSFRGSSVRYVRQFAEDYGASPQYLVQNCRSTRNIIEAANAVIAPARDRMKVSQDITIDRRRAKNPPGGDWSMLDIVAHGRVQIVQVGESVEQQAQYTIGELRRMQSLDIDWDWSQCAVVAREWRYLYPVRSLCEHLGVPVQMADEDFSGIWFLRESKALRDWLKSQDIQIVSAGKVREFVAGLDPNEWTEVLEQCADELELEVGSAGMATSHFIEWFAEWAQEARKQQKGLLLTTAHRAKGLEFDHVFILDGNWDRVSRNEDPDATRRLYYVAMTRARKTLSLGRLADSSNPFFGDLNDVPEVLHRAMPGPLPAPGPELQRHKRRLSMRDVFLSLPGYQHERSNIHRVIASLRSGDQLEVRLRNNQWQLLADGLVVGRLSSRLEIRKGYEIVGANVLAIVNWEKSSSDPAYQERLRCDRWEVVVPELVLAPVLPCV